MENTEYLENLKGYCERNHDMTVVLAGDIARHHAPLYMPMDLSVTPKIRAERYLLRWCKENGLKCIYNFNFDEYSIMKMTAPIKASIPDIQFEEGQG